MTALNSPGDPALKICAQLLLVYVAQEHATMLAPKSDSRQFRDVPSREIPRSVQ
jgi:hypothetical protein